MTTIAFRAGILAVDSGASAGGTFDPFPMTKIVSLKDGSVAVFCGGIARCMNFCSWLDALIADPSSELERPTLEDCGVVRMFQDHILIYEDEGSYLMEGEFGAWGSGSAVANAAMMAGATAVKAVEIACHLDQGTRLPIFTAEQETGK